MGKLERYIIGCAIAAIIIFLVWYFSNVVAYILVSAVLSLIGKPLVTLLCKLKLRKYYMPKWLSATIVVLLMWGVTIVVITIFAPVIFNKIQTFTIVSIESLKEYLGEPFDAFRQYIEANFGYELKTTGDALISDVYTRFSSLLNSGVSSVGSLIDFVTSTFVALFSVTFITFFFMKESDLFNEGVVMLFPQKYEKDVRSAIDTSFNLLSRYFIGLMGESTIKTVLITTALYFVGFDFATSFTIAIISGVLNVIPYIGPLIGVGIGLLIGSTSAVMQANWTHIAIQMTLVFLIFQLIDNIILQPYIYSNSVNAHPLEIFLVILIAGSIAGVWGMLMAIPAYTVLRVFAKIFLNNLRWSEN